MTFKEMVDSLYEFDYDGLNDKELETLEIMLINEIETVRKIIRYNRIDKQHRDGGIKNERI